MQTQNLQIIPRGIKPIIKASQFDVGREFQLKLYDGAVAYTPPTGTALRLDGVKPDGTVFSYTENLSLSGSTITVTTTTQMTILEGTVQCEIRMTKDNDDIGTINFDLMVEKSPINETTDLSQTEVPALVTLARTQMENAEAWAVGTKDGEPVSPDDPQYNNSAKYWAQQVGGETQDAEAWAVGTKDGVPVTSDDPQYHNNAKYYSDEVQTAAQTAAEKALVSEGYATGKQNGTDVASTSPYYHNNAAYYAGQAADDASTAGQAAARAEAAVVLEPYIGANGNWYVYDFSTSAYVDTGVNAIGATGNGIASVAKTSTSGLVDTYTITYTDGTTSTFTVTNGEDGQDGAPGATGNGIVSITKTSTSGLVDTYTILYTNGTTSTFTVTNGQNGTGAGDMLSADYDPTQAVFNAGGIVAYVASQISGLSISLNGLTDVALNNLAAGQTLAYNATSQKWENTSLATVATSGSYADLNNKPTLGTAAAKNSTNAVTQSSTDLVESGAVYSEVTSLNSALSNTNTALGNEVATRAKLGGHNLLPNKGVTKTENGITFTKNSDGSVTVSGTATELTNFAIYHSNDFSNMILSGCPSGGAGDSFGLQYTNGVDQSFSDYGSEVTIPSTKNAGSWVVTIFVISGYSFTTPVTFYPMIRLATDSDTTYQPYSMTNQEITPYIQAISNPNLLDNPWFTVNQRGATSETEVFKYLADRWYIGYNPNASTTFTNTDNVITMTSTGSIAVLCQKLENLALSGKLVTLSIMLSDGTIKVGTGVIPSLNGSDLTVYEDDNFSAYLQRSTNGSGGYPLVGISVKANKSVSFKAVKLELGIASTLAMDTAPNYATELLKCQRYFYRQTFVKAQSIAHFDTSDIWFQMYIHIPKMRVSYPTLNISGALGSISLNNEDVLPSSYSCAETLGGYTIHGIRATTGTTTTGYVFMNEASGGSISLSADL